MRILVATDAWHPQINGVVRTLEAVAVHAPRFGAGIEFLTHERFRSMPMPGYPEIRLAFARARRVETMIRDARADCIHIATEGPIGLAARRACIRNGWPFTSAYHTRLPEYAARRLPIPESLVYALLRWFHRPAAALLVATPMLEADLRARGFANLLRWTRGVDTELFHPQPEMESRSEDPLFLYVGRLAVEKNVEAFLDLDLPGGKLVIGDGPERPRLEAAYPQVRFAGALEGEALARAYREADVFVFPSRTDTFGLVLLEALASGLPIAAYPVMGPVDVLGESGCGVLDDDLGRAAMAALAIPAARCRAHAMGFSWVESVRQFVLAAELACSGSGGDRDAA